MKTKLLKSVSVLASLALATFNSQLSTAQAQGTAFTYQGRLDNNGTPVTGLYDFRFTLENAPSGGLYVGSPQVMNAVPVTNGLFTVTLDFGSVFDGNPRWLLTQVTTNGASSGSTLTPLQHLTPTPYAIYAENAASVNAASIGAPQLNTPGTPSMGQVLAYGMGGLIWETPSTALPFWNLNGNSNTVPGVDYVGTADNRPLELHVNSLRALRIEPTATVPNLIGGYSGNLVDNGAQGVTIAGGGTAGYVNHISSTLGTIAGGSGNLISSNANDATIGGGRQNTVDLASWGGFIGGGRGNWIQTNANYSTIGGGIGNYILNNTPYSVIAGGNGNIAAGLGSAIGGGYGNYTGGFGAVVGGGGFDGSLTSGNTASGNASVVAGGLGNTASGPYSTVSGGGGSAIAYGNFASGYAATVSGGYNNEAPGDYSVVAGGGGQFDMGGGYHGNVAHGPYSVVSGGSGNETIGAYSTVPGGQGNAAQGDYSFAAGNNAQATNQGAFVWADSQNATFSSTASDQFLIRAQGGVGINTNNPHGAALAVNGKITSPMWKATQVINQAGPLPGGGLSASFTSNGGTLLIYVAGTGYSTTPNSNVGMTVVLDGVPIDSCQFYANTANFHVCFLPKTIVKTGASASSHTLILQPRAGTTTDVNDYYAVTVTELPF